MNPILRLHSGQAFSDSFSLRCIQTWGWVYPRDGALEQQAAQETLLASSHLFTMSLEKSKTWDSPGKTVVGLVARPYALPFLISRYFFSDSRKHPLAALLGLSAGVCVGR